MNLIICQASKIKLSLIIKRLQNINNGKAMSDEEMKQMNHTESSSEHATLITLKNDLITLIADQNKKAYSML